jgi:hypothetical protein
MADDRLTVGELKQLLGSVPDHAHVYMVPNDASPYIVPTPLYYEQGPGDENPPSLCFEDLSEHARTYETIESGLCIGPVLRR